MWTRRGWWAALGVLLLVVYLWPTFVRSPERIDVVVVGDGAVASASDELGRHLRERGLRTDVVANVDPCDTDAARAAIAGARAVVVSFAGSSIATCRDAVASFVDSLDDPIVVNQDATGFDDAVDATVLVPPDSGARIGCEWWEPRPPAGAIATCEPDGLITIRDDRGDLTVAGRDRFARVVAGAVP